MLVVVAVVAATKDLAKAQNQKAKTKLEKGEGEGEGEEEGKGKGKEGKEKEEMKAGRRPSLSRQSSAELMEAAKKFVGHHIETAASAASPGAIEWRNPVGGYTRSSEKLGVS